MIKLRLKKRSTLHLYLSQYVIIYAIIITLLLIVFRINNEYILHYSDFYIVSQSNLSKVKFTYIFNVLDTNMKI